VFPPCYAVEHLRGDCLGLSREAAPCFVDLGTHLGAQLGDLRLSGGARIRQSSLTFRLGCGPRGARFLRYFEALCLQIPVVFGPRCLGGGDEPLCFCLCRYGALPSLIQDLENWIEYEAFEPVPKDGKENDLNQER
jgi:hypothetical protein